MVDNSIITEQISSFRDARHIDKTLYLGSNALFYEYNYDSYVPKNDYLNLINDYIEQSSRPWKIQRDGVWTHVVPGKYKGEVHRLPNQGWKIHVSATNTNSNEVLKIVASTLITRSTQFKFANDVETLRLLTSKRWSRGASGKFITIYPTSTEEFKNIIEDLHIPLREHSGSYILSDKRYKDSKCLYYRYGGIISNRISDILGRKTEILSTPDGAMYVDRRNPYYETPYWVDEVFPETDDDAESGESSLCEGRFIISDAISFSNTGGVYLAFDNVLNKKVVVKEARPGVELASNGEDATARLRHEADVLRCMSGSGITPDLITTFQDWENFYLVEEFVDGLNIRQIMLEFSPLMKSSKKYGQSDEFFEIFTTIFVHLLSAISEFHERGIVIGDLSPTNIFVSKDMNKVTIIDLEGAFSLSSEVRQEIHTPGFRPKTKRKKQESNYNDDIYAVGVIMLYSMFPIAAMAYLRDDVLEKVLPVLVNDLRWQGTGIREIITDLLNVKITSLEASNRLRIANISSREINIFRPNTIHTNVDKIYSGMAQFLISSFRSDKSLTSFPIDPFGKLTNPQSLFFGSSGIIWTLVLCGYTIPDEVWRRCEPEFSKLDPNTFPEGLATGVAGIAFFLIEIGRIDLAGTLLEHLVYKDLTDTHHSLYYGKAGIGIVMIRAWKETQNNLYLDKALNIANLLKEASTRNDKGTYWEDAGGIRVGLGYGQSGVAIFLLRLSQVTGDLSWRELGLSALKYDLSQAVELEPGAASFPGEVREKPLEQTVFPYIEQGSAGIAKVAIRFGLIDQVENLFPSVFRKYCGYPGLIFGLAGFVDVLVDAQLYSSKLKYADMVKLPIKGLEDIYIFETYLGIAVPGENLFRVSCDYATGVAGVMSTLFRYNHSRGDRLMLDWIDNLP